MGDERRSEGAGAVVAIVVVLGILLLIAVMVVIGGAMFFFVARTRSGPMTAPTAVKTATTAVPEVLLEIDAAGAMTLSRLPVSEAELAHALSQAKSDHGGNVRLILRAAKQTPFETVSKIMETAKSAGIEGVSVTMAE